MHFSKTLRELRIKNGFTQETLARKLNVAKSTISMYEAGKRMPTSETMVTLSEIFGVDMNYLYGRVSTIEEPTAALDDGLGEDVVVFHRDGKMQIRQLTKEQLVLFHALVDAIPETPKDL